MIEWIVTIIALMIQFYGITHCSKFSKKELILVCLGVGSCQIAVKNSLISPMSWYRDTLFIYLLTQMSIKDIQKKMVERKDLILGLLLNGLGMTSIYILELMPIEKKIMFLSPQFQADLYTVGLQIIIASSVLICGYLLHIVSRNGIGIGDIWVLVLMSLFFEWKIVLIIFLLSMILAGFMSLFMLLVKRKSKQYRLPFVPFIGLAMMITIMMSCI